MKQQKPFKVDRYKEREEMAQLPAPIKTLSRSQKRAIAHADKLGVQMQKAASVFGLQRDHIIQNVDVGNVDQALSTFKKVAFSTVVAMIPLAEREYRGSRRESQAYALNALIHTARELGQDLEAAHDRAALAESVVLEVMEPMFRDLLQYILQQQIVLKAVLNDKVDKRHVDGISSQMDTSIRETAAHMQQLYKDAALKIRKAVNGD